MKTEKKNKRREWEEKILKSFLEKFPERKKYFHTDSGIEIQRIYDTLANELEYPAEFPFTRGITPTMYRGKLWTMRQYAGFATAEESNKRYRYLLSKGTTGLSVAFDLPTQIGYDSSDPMAEGEVGKVGVAIDSLKDMEILFDGIKLENITTSMTINATAAILLAMYVAVAKKQKANLKKISGTVQNDILKEYAARGTYIYPPQPSMRLVTDVFEWCAKELPKWNTISISGYHIREAGATAAQELAFTLSNGKSYVRAALDRGLNIDEFGKQLSFFFNSHNNLFEEVAKFRAARRMWAKIMKDFGAKDLRTMMLRFHAQTGGSTLTAQQPHNNIVRVTVQALAAILGGAQSLHTNGFDEALSLPTEHAAKIALRTQQILAYESGVTDTVDPLGGSYFIEKLMDEIEKAANDYIKIIDKKGGSVRAIEEGYIQNEISHSAYLYQQGIETKEKIVVGVNKFEEEEAEEEQFQIDESVQKKQIKKINAIKKSRDNKKVENLLLRLQNHAEENVNLMPDILSCAENYATLGEIAGALRKVWGEYST